MKKIFSFRLYAEGLKRLRLPGFATGIVITLLMCAEPIIKRFEWGEPCGCGRPHMYITSMSQFALPLLLLLIAMPLFIFVMFAFLNRRNASDFYHSIPYKRTCIFCSFLAAVYSWFLGILAVALGGSVLFWNLAYARLEWELIFWTFGLFAMGAVLVGGFCLLAKALTGNGFSDGMLFLVLALGFRIIGWIIVEHLETAVSEIDFQYTVMKIFSMETSILVVGAKAFDDPSVLYSPVMWIFNACVILLLHALAGFFFAKRRSETAEKTGSKKGLQHFYSCGFSLPLALLATSYLIKPDFEKNLLYTILFTLGTIAVFYLCELWSYKKLWKAFKATPLLGAVILLCGIFAGGSFLCKYYANSQTFDPKEIQSVRFYSRGSLLDVGETEEKNPAESFLMDFPFPADCDFEIKDEAFIETITELWASPKDTKDEIYYYIAFQMKDGSTVGRKLKVDVKENKQLYQNLCDVREYQDVYVDLVETHGCEIYSFDLELNVDEELYDTFWDEYNALDTEQKFAYFMESDSKAGYLDTYSVHRFAYAREYCNYGQPVLRLSDGGHRHVYAVLNENFPRTTALLKSEISKRNSTGLQELKELLSLEEQARLEAFKNSNLYIDMDVSFGKFNAYLGLWESSWSEDIILKKLEVLSKIILNDSEIFYGTDSRCSISHSFEYDTYKSFHVDIYPIAYDNMDMELFKDVIRAGSSNTLLRISLEPDSNSSKVAWKGEPFHIMLCFSNGEEYLLSVTEENYDGFLEAWAKVPTKFWEPDKPIAVGDKGTVEIFIFTSERTSYNIFRTVELPEEIKERFRNFS